MANPKISVTLTVDQSIIDALNAHTEALNRFCGAKAADVVLDDKSTIAPTTATPVEQNPTPAPIPTTVSPTINVAPPTAQVLSADPAPVVNAAEPASPVLPLQQPVPPSVAVPVQQQAFAIPVAQPEVITIESLMRAGVDLMNRGVNAAAVLTEFGVQALTELPKEKYPAMAARLRQLGATIQ